jgi:methylenetetrahydrofolate dehydrogenase (NADP+)/methenyltetrahydrofolate cyclohydrolase
MIDCKKMAQERKDKLKAYIQENNWTGSLAVIQVGNDPASDAYIRGKRKDCEEVGIEFELSRHSENVIDDIIINDIIRLNLDKRVKGIIVQLPLPSHLDKEGILAYICPSKDVDGFQHDSPFTPCTPKAVMTILEELGVDVDGKVCCVIGRGMVGKPMVDILTKKNATVVWCNSHTPPSELRYALLTSEVVISAAGVPNLIDDARGRYGQVVIDVGITKGGDGKLCGDVNKCLYSDNAQITPVPGGVGLMTRVALLENVVYGGNNK